MNPTVFTSSFQAFFRGDVFPVCRSSMIKLLPNHLFDSRPRRQGQATLTVSGLSTFLRGRAGVKLVVVESRNRTWTTSYVSITPSFTGYLIQHITAKTRNRTWDTTYATTTPTQLPNFQVAGSVVCINLSRPCPY